MNGSDWLTENLVCPHDLGPLRWTAEAAFCPVGHRLPVVHGIPIALRDDVPPSHELWRTTAADVTRLAVDPTVAKTPAPKTVDPFVERALVATCGNLYRGCARPLPRYPIPDLPLPEGEGRLFLDIGANWGRWSFAAAQRGYRVVAIDPSLNAALAGARVARQLGLPVSFLVGDGRYLPFRSATFDVVFSYSVLQHLDKATVRVILREAARTTRVGGVVRTQMANLFGPRQLMNRAIGGGRSLIRSLLGERRARYGFRVRGWSPDELRKTFSELIGPSTLTADGFLSLNARASDTDLLGPLRATIVRVSERLRALADETPSLARFADSFWIEAVREMRPTAPLT